MLLVAVTSIAPGQLTTTGVRGIVRDPSGAVIPNASLVLKDTATGIEKTTTATDGGIFALPNLQAGTYILTCKADGFQTAVYNKVEVAAGRNTDLVVEMKVGSPATSIEVSATAVALETTSNEVGTTINNNSINNLPYASRDTLNFALYMPGAQSASGGSTFNGLPNASLNITIDGMNNNSSRFKSGGTSFYGFAPTRIDAIEEVTVSTTGLGADAAAGGAMQIRFTTRRGTSQYKFHLLYQAANEAFNANSYWNKLTSTRRSKTRTANYVGSIGGPLVPWSSYFRNRLFVFANFEDLPQPGSRTYSTSMLMPEVYQGIYTYLGTLLSKTGSCTLK
jgi:hypothetical protein